MADWASTGDAYATSFAALCAGAVDAVLDEAGERTAGRRLLDVGTGPGTVAAAAHARGWTVAGVDAEESMIATARRLNPGIPFRIGTLPGLDEPDDSADAVTANFVLNHVPDARAAVAGLAQVATLGGVVVVTIWHGTTSPLRPLWDRVLDAAGLDRPAGNRLPAEPDFERDTTGVAGVLADGGLDDVRARLVSWDFAFAPEQLWSGVEGGVATMGGIHRAQDVATRARMREAYLRITAEITDPVDGLVHVPHSAVLASGMVPAAGGVLG
jgi:SAM-dependent methyltransferase